MRDAFIRMLTRLAEHDKRIMLITGDLGFGVLEDFEKRFPKQYLNAGVAEQNMTGIATGMAMEGRVVFTYSIANFPTLRCLEQIRNDACYHAASVKVVSIGAGFSYGAVGASHHATEDMAIVRALPNIMVVSPGDDWETEQLTEAVVNTPGPALLRLDRASVASTQLPGEVFKAGVPRKLREGRDICLVSTGGMLSVVLKAAESLAGEGVLCRVLHYHTVKPFDVAPLVTAAKETAGLITVEEHTVSGGFGGLVAEELLEHGGRPEIFYRLGLRGGFSSTVGSQDYLRKVYGLDAPAIHAKVLEVLGKAGKLRPASKKVATK